MKIKLISQIIGILILGAIGAFLFQVFIFPWMLFDPYFERFEFIKSFKEGKIVINPKEQIFIQENTALEQAIERVSKSVVAIQTITTAGTFLGSGFIVTSDGSILTLNDLAPAGAKITVYLADEKFTPKIIKKDAKNNLALLKVEKTGLTTAGFSDPDKIKPGKRVFLLGKNVTTKEEIVNEGIIKAISKEAIKTTIVDSSYLQGGPLFDIQGNLVGINIVDANAKISAIPISKIKPFAGL